MKNGAAPPQIRAAALSLVSEYLCKPEVLQARNHPLGFLWVPLTDRSADEALRLHIWPEDAAIQNGNFVIHDHMFSFDSFVLHGEIRNDEYEVIESESGDMQLFNVEYNQTVSILVPSGTRVDCRRIRSKTCRCGDLYSLPATTFHTTTVADAQFAATVVLTRSEPAKTPHVVGPAAVKSQSVCQRQLVEWTQVAPYLDRLLAR